MKIEVITSLVELTRLRAEWDKLAMHDPRDAFFRSGGWVIPWFRHIRPEAQPLVIAVRDCGGELVGLAPLCRTRFKDLGFTLAGVGLGGREVVSGDYLDFLSAPEVKPKVLNIMLDFLWEQRHLWKLLIVGEVIVGGDLHNALRAWGERSGLAIRQQEMRKCPFISLPSTFEEYLAGMSSKFRKKVRYETRTVFERHGGRIEVYSDPDEMRGALEILIRLNVARWRRANLPGTLGRPGFESFLREVCATPPAGAQPCLYMLKHNGRAVAALLAFHCGQSCLYYSIGWEADSPFASVSQGEVLIGYTIQDAISRGLRYFDFLRGYEKYKSHWSNTYRTTVTVLLARGLIERVYLATAHAKDLAKRFLLWSPESAKMGGL